jgi:hypothetical protein
VSARAKGPADLLCPSAPPEWSGAVAIGVVGGTAETPRVTNLAVPVPVTPALLELAAPVEPTEVFRFAAPCAHGGCQHYRDRNCQLAAKVVNMLAPATDRLPYCTIRANCRWYAQEGRAACLRCPQVVTDNVHPSTTMRRAADPAVLAQRLPE